MKFCKYYDKIFTIILCKNNRKFYMLYKQNFLYQLLVFQFFFSTTSRYQPMSMFNVKNEIWDSTETKDTPYLIFTSRSDTVPHPAMVNMTHNTKTTEAI